MYVVELGSVRKGSMKSPHLSINDQLLHFSRLVRRTKLVAGIIDRCRKHISNPPAVIS